MCCIIYFNTVLSHLSYEDGHPSQSESDVLQRQTFAASHQLPGYAPMPQATGNSPFVKFMTVVILSG